jgi:hypothetical protein
MFWRDALESHRRLQFSELTKVQQVELDKRGIDTLSVDNGRFLLTEYPWRPGFRVTAAALLGMSGEIEKGPRSAATWQVVDYSFIKLGDNAMANSGGELVPAWYYRAESGVRVVFDRASHGWITMSP